MSERINLASSKATTVWSVVFCVSLLLGIFILAEYLYGSPTYIADREEPECRTFVVRKVDACNPSSCDVVTLNLDRETVTAPASEGEERTICRYVFRAHRAPR